MRPTTATSLDISPILLRQACLTAVSLVAVWCALAPDAPAATLTTTRPTLDREVPLTRPEWFWSSVPPGRSATLEDHARILWFNAQGVRAHDLYPTLRAEEGGNDRREVLELRVEPPIDEPTLDSTDWTGVVTGLSYFDLDFTRLDAVEIWVNDFHSDHRDTRGVLRVQLGRFDEDAFWDRLRPPNTMLDTEDKNHDGRLDRPGDPDKKDNPLWEDTGLDGLVDWQEPGYDAITNPDPNGDDYTYTAESPNDYSTINNTEGNGLFSDPNARPDTEDLNQNAVLERENAYFELPITLADTAFTEVDVPRAYAGNEHVSVDNGWRLFRLPRAAFQSVGDASWAAVQGIRFILDGSVEPLRLQVGGIRFVGIPSPIVRRAVTLYQNRPNPFNPTTWIPYELRNAGEVRLDIFDVTGRLVRTLIDGPVTEGAHFAVWNGRDGQDAPVTSGVYFYQLRTPAGVEARRMVLMK